MINKNMHPLRKGFRYFLFGCLLLSFCFLISIVFFRVAYKDRNLPASVAVVSLHADVLQHKARAFVSNDTQDMKIIAQLFQLGFISRIYSDAGYEMLKDKAEDGYAPAKMQLALIENPPVQEQQ